MVKESTCNAGDLGSIPGKRQPTPVFLPGEFRGQMSWWATVHGVPESWRKINFSKINFVQVISESINKYKLI